MLFHVWSLFVDVMAHRALMAGTTNDDSDDEDCVGLNDHKASEKLVSFFFKSGFRVFFSFFCA